MAHSWQVSKQQTLHQHGLPSMEVLCLQIFFPATFLKMRCTIPLQFNLFIARLLTFFLFSSLPGGGKQEKKIFRGHSTRQKMGYSFLCFRKLCLAFLQYLP